MGRMTVALVCLVRGARASRLHITDEQRQGFVFPDAWRDAGNLEPMKRFANLLLAKTMCLHAGKQCSGVDRNTLRSKAKRVLRAALLALPGDNVEEEDPSPGEKTLGNASAQSQDRRLRSLLEISHEACKAISELVATIYSSHITEETTLRKADASAFTIADGLVQHFLKVLLEGKVAEIVGEEDNSLIRLVPGQAYMVDTIEIPNSLTAMIDETLNKMRLLRQHIPSSMYHDLVAFIDPIDGTREFINGCGEQCTICLGFTDLDSGKVMAGIVYRPITGTWAAGAVAENYKAGNLPTSLNKSGLLATNRTVSQFTLSLQEELEMELVRAGGAGHKVLLLLEGLGSAYIQDRGLNRWDTCAGEAVLDAFGGRLVRLDKVLEDGTLQAYTYRKGNENTDFQPLACYTKYNSFARGNSSTLVDINCIKPYSNICGLFALAPSQIHLLDKYVIAAQRANQQVPASFD